jgi:hypothetical protein
MQTHSLGISNKKASLNCETLLHSSGMRHQDKQHWEEKEVSTPET